MATKGKLPAKANQPDVSREISTIFESMQNDPHVISFEIKSNKETGVVRYTARSSDGRIITNTVLGPGLEESVRYDPSKNSLINRDRNIRTLLDKGLTQQDVAIRMGVSQALVSKVHRSTKE